MSWFSRLIARWASSAFCLLLLSVVGRQMGLEAMVCSRWGTMGNKSLLREGDVIIGGLFNLYYIPSAVEQDFSRQPHYEPCTG